MHGMVSHSMDPNGMNWEGRIILILPWNIGSDGNAHIKYNKSYVGWVLIPEVILFLPGLPTYVPVEVIKTQPVRKDIVWFQEF